MNELSEIVSFWERRNDQPMALATLVRVRGSSYRRPGARMLITSDGTSAGSLSAGCIEEEVVAVAREVMRTRQPQLMTFDTRRRFGCNGSIEIFVEPASEDVLQVLRDSLDARRSCEIATAFKNDGSLDSLSLGSKASSLYSAGEGLCSPVSRSETLRGRDDHDDHLPTDGVFVQTIEPPLRLMVIGDGPDAIALRAHATLLGWETIVIQAIPELREAPDERTAVVVATHNFGRDCAALRYLLPLGLRYIGLVGPRRRRDEILIDVIDSGAELRSELFAPAGLNLAAESPQEIALAIAAEIQSVFAGGTAEHLRDRKAPIHATRRQSGSDSQWAASAR